MPPDRPASATRAEGPFVGREDELASVRRMLAPEGALVTLIGSPGAGASRLGREVASEGFKRTQIIEAGQLAGLGAAQARQLELLVIDDVDALVLAVGEELEALRELAPELRVLVVGDEALGLDREQVTVVGTLSEESAVSLYIERMPEEARPSVRQEDVRALVRRVAGLPLAVELAALQAATYSARDLLNATARDGALDLSRFRTSRRSWPARRSSLEGAFAASWEASGPEERAVLVAIAAFAAPPRLDDIDAMTDATIGPSGTTDPLAAVETLVRRQLVHRARREGLDAGAGFSRLELAPLLQDDVRARVRAATGPRFARVAQRHAEVVLARLEALEPRLYGPEAPAALAEIAASLPDVRAAFVRMKERDRALAARLVVPLGELAAFARGIATDDPLFAAAVTAADTTGDLVLRARTRHVRAKMLLEQNEPAAALSLLDEARERLSRNLVTAAVTSLAADVERTRGWAALAMLDLAGATDRFDRALQVHRAGRDARGQADACAGLAVAARLGGEEARALRLFESSYGIHLVAGDTVRQAKVGEMARLVGLALPETRPEHRHRSAAELRATADEHRTSGRPWRDAIARLELARKLAQDGDRAGSRVALTEARASAELAGGNAEWIAALEAEVGAATADVPGWRIADDATRVTAPDGARIDLRTRPVLRRILAALAAVRVATPGRALGVDAILAAGWPGERVQHAAGLLRVYTAIKRLRGLGLQALLCTSEDGYLLDVATPVTVG